MLWDSLEDIFLDVCPINVYWLLLFIVALLETRNYPSPHAKCLQVGIKSQRPSYIPSYLPSLPDQHTYIKTPVSNSLY